MFALSQDKWDKPDEVCTKTKNAMDAVLLNAQNADDGKAIATRGTAYNLLQSFTRYIDHQRPTRVTTQARLNGVTTGPWRADGHQL